ncbi:MAG: hypothetical protein WBC97_12325 [Gemmatimonadales bacterium]
MPFKRLLPLLLAAAAACGPDYSVVPSQSASVSIISGNTQVGSAGTTLAAPVVILVTDSTGAPAVGVAMTWTPSAGNGSVSASAVTDAAGHASATWTLGSVIGDQHLTARATGIGTAVALAILPAFAATQVTVGTGFACGIDAAGAAHCWGNNPSGVFGNAALPPSLIPVLVPGGLVFAQIHAGADFVCGLTTTPQEVWCWGSNAHGQRGVSGSPAAAPVLVSGGHTWLGLAAGGQSACGIASDSTAWCWGVNGYGQLGDGTLGTDRFAPVAVKDSIKFTTLSVSSTHSCGISASRRLWCWGRNADRELGADSTGTEYMVPVPVASAATTGFLADAVATGAFHTCAVGVGRTYCWGADLFGQIGNKTISATDVALPTVIDSTLGMVTLGADSASTVALGTGTKEYWWGSRGPNLSAPAAADRSVQPELVLPYLFSSFATGQSVSCGIYSRNYVFCWGSSADPNFPAADLPAGVPAP